MSQKTADDERRWMPDATPIDSTHSEHPPSDDEDYSHSSPLESSTTSLAEEFDFEVVGRGLDFQWAREADAKSETLSSAGGSVRSESFAEESASAENSYECCSTGTGNSSPELITPAMSPTPIHRKLNEPITIAKMPIADENEKIEAIQVLPAYEIWMRWMLRSLFEVKDIDVIIRETHQKSSRLADQVVSFFCPLSLCMRYLFPTSILGLLLLVCAPLYHSNNSSISRQASALRSIVVDQALESSVVPAVRPIEPFDQGSNEVIYALAGGWEDADSKNVHRFRIQAINLNGTQRSDADTVFAVIVVPNRKNGDELDSIAFHARPENTGWYTFAFTNTASENEKTVVEIYAAPRSPRKPKRVGRARGSALKSTFVGNHINGSPFVVHGRSSLQPEVLKVNEKWPLGTAEPLGSPPASGTDEAYSVAKEHSSNGIDHFVNLLYDLTWSGPVRLVTKVEHIGANLQQEAVAITSVIVQSITDAAHAVEQWFGAVWQFAREKVPSANLSRKPKDYADKITNAAQAAVRYIPIPSVPESWSVKAANNAATQYAQQVADEYAKAHDIVKKSSATNAKWLAEEVKSAKERVVKASTQSAHLAAHIVAHELARAKHFAEHTSAHFSAHALAQELSKAKDLVADATARSAHTVAHEIAKAQHLAAHAAASSAHTLAHELAKAKHMAAEVSHRSVKHVSSTARVVMDSKTWLDGIEVVKSTVEKVISTGEEAKNEPVAKAEGDDGWFGSALEKLNFWGVNSKADRPSNSEMTTQDDEDINGSHRSWWARSADSVNEVCRDLIDYNHIGVLAIARQLRSFSAPFTKSSSEPTSSAQSLTMEKKMDFDGKEWKEIFRKKETKTIQTAGVMEEESVWNWLPWKRNIPSDVSDTDFAESHTESTDFSWNPFRWLPKQLSQVSSLTDATFVTNEDTVPSKFQLWYNAIFTNSDDNGKDGQAAESETIGIIPRYRNLISSFMDTSDAASTVVADEKKRSRFADFFGM